MTLETMLKEQKNTNCSGEEESSRHIAEQVKLETRSSPSLAKGQGNLKTLFDSFTMDAHHASVVFGTVTQDFDYTRFEEEASTDDIVNESIWELFRLLFPLDVWLPHATIQSKRNLYFAQKDRVD